MAYDALLPKIGELLVGFLSPMSASASSSVQVRQDLDALQGTLGRIRAVLDDAEKRGIREQSVKLWLRELSDLAYDADDVLDEYNYELLRAKVEADMGAEAASHPPGMQQHHHEVTSPSRDFLSWDKLANRIGQMRQRFEKISHERDALRLDEEHEGEGRKTSALPPPSSSLPDTARIYGREGDKDKVISMLLLSDGCKEHNLSVLPIVGMGGVGKTTLVQHVYHDQRVRDHFPLRGWVCVSDESAVDSLTKNIIESLTGEACQLNGFDGIQNKLIQVLKGNRFLIVLDDVWNDKSFFWNSLLKPFRLASTLGSAVITTTRIESVARMVRLITPIYRLDCLSDDDCRLIFEQTVFSGQDPKDHPGLVQIGENIVKKCRGLPLAVKVLGSLLRNEFDCDRWEDILQSEIWELEDQNNEIIPALRLSYLRLPSYLKPCFLYACVFPKDYKFYKRELVPLWMAQGFIRCQGPRKQMEDVGSSYFDDLVKRSLFSLVRTKVEECYVMHDLIHDLAQSISEGVCSRTDRVEDRLYVKKDRHVFMSRQRIDDINLMLNFPCAMRSFLVSSYGPSTPILSDRMLQNLKLLMVLDLRGSVISNLPDSVGDLKHLHYLSLQRCFHIEKLPESVCKLFHLEVFNLNHCHRLRSLPERISGLCKLRCLDMFRCFFSYDMSLVKPKIRVLSLRSTDI